MQMNRWLFALTVPLLFCGAQARAQTADPPTGVIPTYVIDTADPENHVINGVRIRWAPAPTQEGFHVVGYNLFRATAPTGPWTKVNDFDIDPDQPVQYVDVAPADPANTWYAVTTLESNDFDVIESAKSEPAQAANNLLFNAGFERANGADPSGWAFGTWGNDGTGGMTPDEKTQGDFGVFLKTGATSRGGQYINTVEEFQPPTAQGVPYVIGMYGRFQDTHTTWPLALRQAYGGENADWNGRPTVIDWYPNNATGTVSDWDSKPLTSVTSTPWTWLGNTAGAVPHPGSSTTRIGVFWANDGLTTLGVSTAFADDAAFQRKTVGATGDIWGVIQQQNANPVSARVSGGGKTAWTDPYRGRFVLRNVPTGMVTLTIETGTGPDHVITVPNYGGFVYFGKDSSGKITLWDESGLPLKVTGKVTLPNGQPAVGATVKITNPRFDPVTDTTDANGMYEFENLGSWDFSMITASLAPYTTVSVSKAFGLNGWNNYNLQLGAAPARFEIGKTSTPPTIDGVVNLATEWSKSQPIPITRRAGNLPPTVKSTAYAMWDDYNLYLAFVAEEPNPAGIEARATGHDNSMIYTYDGGATWNADDVAAVWLDPTMAQSPDPGHEQWQIITNLNQTNPSYMDISWGPWNAASDIFGFEFKSKIDAANKQWSIEMVIPFDDLGITGGMPSPVVRAGTEWFVQLQRTRHQPLPDGESHSTGWVIGTFVNAISPFPKGDLNGDRVVNTADVLIALRVAAGIESLGNRLPQGDVTADNSVTVLDAARIIRKVQGLDNF